MIFNTIILITILLALFFEAKEDASWYKYQIKKLPTLIKAHVYQNLYTFTLLFGTLLACTYKDNLNYIDILIILIGYVLIRFALFDWLFNIMTNRFWLYIGENSYYDLILKKIFKGNAILFLIILKMISLISGLYLLQRIL